MKYTRTTITHEQVYTLMCAVKEKYSEKAPDLFSKEIAAELSKELGFKVSSSAVVKAFDYHNIPRKGHHTAPRASEQDLEKKVEGLGKQITELLSRVADLEMIA